MITLSGACHCRAVRFEIDLPRGLEAPQRCTCSLCRMRGAVVVSVPIRHFRLLQGETALRLYTFNTGVAKHWFCGVCGIYTHHRQRLLPDEYNVNVACLEGVSPFDFPAIPVMDGVVHPRDVGPDAVQRQAGTLRFEPAPSQDRSPS